MRRLTALVVVAALALSALPLPAEAATSDLRPRISATYSKGSAENTGVGEARPTLPEAPQDIAPPQRSGGYFTFRLTCDASGSNCDAEPPLVNWDFGDGTVAENQGPTVTHEYVTPGVYTVRATATKGQTWFGETTRVVYVSPHYSDIQTAVTYRTGVLADEPYAYWPLDSDTEDAAPGSRNSLEAAGEGEVTFDAAAGLNLATNPSAAFDGETWAEGTWTGPEDRNGNLTEATIELWARTTSESTDATTLLSYSNDTYTDAIRISNPESVTVQLGASIVDTSTSVADGAWHHIRLTWSSLSGFASISIDGAEVYAAGPGKAERFAQGTVIENGGVIVIGADVGEGVDASTAFEGQIDEVAIWDKALPSATAKDRYQAGMAARAAVDRPDRESLWVGGALGIFPPCRVGTAASGAYGLGIGRAQFCPEPAGVAPAPEFPDDTPAVNAITGEDCLARAGACGWPLSYFGDSYSEADEVGVTALKADGYIKEGPGGEWLLDEYKPDVCGDGWVYRNGRFEKGSEQGCLTRGDWYRALIRAVDGRAADDFVASPNRVTANTTTTTCEDIDTESSDERWFSLLRAIRLGIAETVTHPDTPGVRFCDIDRTVTKYEAFLSLGYALGAVDGACGEFIRDLFGDEATGAGGQDPNCGRIYTSILTGVPLVGALTCPDEGEEDAPEGICFNPDEYLTRAEGAVLISGVLVREIPASNALSVHVTADPAADAETPASVNHPITVTAVVAAPPVPESFGTYSVSFAIDGDASGITTTCPPVAQDTATSEDIVGGTQLQLVFSCRFTMQQERTVTVKVDVTGPPPENAEVSGQTTLFAVNYPPFINDVGTHETLDEGPGSDSVTAIATDPAGQDVYFEVASTPEGPFVGADVEEDAYGSRIRLIDQPIGWWRLDEASRFTKVRWFDVRDSKFDGGVDEVNYYPTASTMDSFFDPDEVELKGTADHPYALSFISTKPPYMESQRNNYFSWQADTYLYVPESGTWWFAINAGDAADVSIDGQMVVSAYGRRPIGADQSWDATGSVTLEAGWHKLRARLVQGSNSSATNSTGFGFQLGWHKDTDDSYTIIPAHQFGQPLIDHTQDLGDPNWDATQGNPAQAVGGHTELLVSNPALAATTGGASYRLTGGPQAGIVSNPHTTHLWPLDFSGADLVGDRPMVLEKLDLDRAGPGGHDGWRSNTFNHDFDRGVVEDFSGFGSAAGGIEFWMRSNPNFGNRTIVSYAAGSANAFHVGNPASLTVYRGNFSLDTGENLTDNEWHHVSVWYEIDQGNTLTLGATIDGGETHIETFSTSAGLMGATGRLVVGDYQTAPATSDPAYDPARSYRGQLAQVATYDTSRQSSYGGATPPPHIALPAHTGHYEADNDRSVELWFATGEDTTRRQVVYAEGAAATSGLVAYVDEERLWVGGWSAGEWEAFGDVSVDPNTTYHLTIVLDDNVLAGYLNGAEFWSTPAAGPLSERAAGTVGAAIRSVLFDDRSVASGSPMAGKVDEIALYDQALDPAAVRLHHELGSGTIVARELLEDGEDLAFGEAVATVRVASVGSPAEITATPVTADAFGQATYWVRACDEGGKCSDPKALDVSVVPTPDTPRAREGGVIAEMEEDVTLFEGFRLEGSDHPDVGTGGYTGEIARYRIVTPPAKGTLRYDHDGDPSTAPVNVTASGAEFTNPILSYKPSTPDGDGLIPFTYQVLDSGAPGGGTWSPTKVAWINVVDTNSAPTCQTGKTFSGTEDTQSTFSLTSVCSDPDGDPLTFMVTRGSGHKIQTATVSGSNLTFRANANECGTGSNNSKFPLNVSAKDPYGLTSNTVEVRVNVTCVNDPPTLAAGSIGPVLFEWGAEPNATSTNRTFSWTDPDSGQPGPTQTWTLEISSSSSSGYVTAPGVDVRYGRSAYGTNNANYYARIINNQNTSNLSEAVRFYAPRVCSTFPDDYDRTLGYLYVRVHDGHARSNPATVYVKCA